jgi:hypothetical protein
MGVGAAEFPAVRGRESLLSLGVDSGLWPEFGAQPLYIQQRNLPTGTPAMGIVLSEWHAINCEF